MSDKLTDQLMWLPQSVHAARRRAMMDRMGSRSAAIIPSAPVAVRSNDVDYPYRADNDLLYLTGFREPEAVCLLIPDRQQGEYVLFVRGRDREREIWTGHRAGIEGAIAEYGADAAFDRQELEQRVSELIGDRDSIYYGFGRDAALNAAVTRWLQQWRQARPRSGKGPIALLDPSEILHEMRLFKGDEEVAAMRDAARISAIAHRAALQAVRPGMFEYEIEALLDYNFRRGGGSGPAYPSIVAGGRNATILHYTDNDQRLNDGDLLLIDAGAEYRGYCSDVTRTFPVGERFSSAQRCVYDLVLKAQCAAIEVVKPGVGIDAPHQRAVEVLVDGFLSLGLLQGDAKEIIAKETYRNLYMHRTSHWLGMDVHDVGGYKSADGFRTLEPGMVLTVEPGAYIAVDAPDIAPQYRGIGVRIEDDVLVTATGHEVLTAAILKDADEIESVRAGAARLKEPVID